MSITVLLQPHFTSAALSLPPSFLRDHVDLLITSTVDAGYKHKELDRYARALWPAARYPGPRRTGRRRPRPPHGRPAGGYPPRHPRWPGSP